MAPKDQTKTPKIIILFINDQCLGTSFFAINIIKITRRFGSDSLHDIHFSY